MQSVPPSCELSIVMPCYNEQECIEKVVREWTETVVARIASAEIVAVDDGSRDSTGAILDRLRSELPHLRVLHQANAGHGPALRAGLEAARGDWVFHVDSDDQFDPQDFWKLWNARDDGDYLCGYRSQRHDPLHRLVITRVVRLLNWLLFGAYLRDANVPFKLIRRPALERILAAIPRGVFAPSIMMSLAAKRWVRFAEVPVGHRRRATGKVSILGWRLLKACTRSAAELWSFRSALQ